MSREAALSSQNVTGSENEITQRLPVLFAGCADEMSESRQTHVTLHDIDPQALEQLVQYAYTAEIVVGEGNVQVKNGPIASHCGSVHTDSRRRLRLRLPDAAAGGQLAAAQRRAGRVLQVPAQPAGPLKLPGHPGVRRHALLQRPAQVGSQVRPAALCGGVQDRGVHAAATETGRRVCFGGGVHAKTLIMNP